MMLPYTIEVYLATLAAYNADYFPLSLLAWLALLGGLLAICFRLGESLWRDRVLAILLGALWLWVGLVHQREIMAALNFMAPLYGLLWAAQGGLLILLGLGGLLRFAWPGGARGVLALFLGLAGLLLYPLCILFLGYEWQALPLAGTAPNPTAILSLAFLLMLKGRRLPLLLLLGPLAWGGVAALSAHLLSFPLDYSVLAAALLALGATIRESAKRTPG